MTDLRQVFLQPSSPVLRKYEALRAHFVEGCTTAEAAERFGYRPGSLRNLCSQLRKNPDGSATGFYASRSAIAATRMSLRKSPWEFRLGRPRPRML